MSDGSGYIQFVVLVVVGGGVVGVVAVVAVFADVVAVGTVSLDNFQCCNFSVHVAAAFAAEAKQWSVASCYCY